PPAVGRPARPFRPRLRRPRGPGRTRWRSRPRGLGLGLERKLRALSVGATWKVKRPILSTRRVRDVCHEARTWNATFRSTCGALWRYGALWGSPRVLPAARSPHIQDDPPWSTKASSTPSAAPL